MAGTFEVFQDKAGEYRFRLKAGNGQIVLTSEGYSAKAGAMNGIESVTKNADDDSRFERTETEKGAFRFSLKAANHQIIGTSQNYESASSRDNGIEAVARAATGAAVEDLTVQA
jgi:uncharacterized protein YegP (UPF0339 family)